MTKMFFSRIFSAALLTNVCGQSAYAFKDFEDDKVSSARHLLHIGYKTDKHRFKESSQKAFELYEEAKKLKDDGEKSLKYNAKPYIIKTFLDIIILFLPPQQPLTPEAADLFLQSAKLGYAPAMVALGDIEAKWGNMKRSQYWYEKAANESDLMAYHRLANLFYDKKEFIGAVYWYKKTVAPDGHPIFLDGVTELVTQAKITSLELSIAPGKS